MATLVTRPGDPQALKAALAAGAAGAPLAVADAARGGADAEALPPFAAPYLALLLPGGAGALGEPNAMARYAAAAAGAAPPGAAAEAWLEWEAAVLRPAVYGGDDAALAAALARLPPGGALLPPGAPGALLADAVVFATLRAAALLGRSLPPPAAALFARVGATPAALAAVAAVALDAASPSAAAAAVAAADASAAAAARPPLPAPGRRNVLVTSALPYVNNVPHLGNIIGCVLSADAYARFCRARGHATLFVCGTDEYGTATETRALEEGLSCAALCDKYHAVHAAVYAWFGCAFDHFGRTPSRAQTAIGQEAFAQLRAAGFLEEDEVEQLFSEPLGRFLADRFVVGTCPRCGAADARGDQCDGCGALLNPTELLAPRCAITGAAPVLRSTRHVFLDLPKLAPALQAFATAAGAGGRWSPNCVAVTKAWMDGGLRRRCITRDLRWGTPVPLPGFEKKVFYVWFDAPIGYCSITAGLCGEAWRAWWLPAEWAAEAGQEEAADVELVQFMGKDNVPFHTVIFPATQLGTGRPWAMAHAISATEYLNYEDGKFSKSRGVGVFGTDAIDSGVPAAAWRYYLLAVRPEGADAAFQWPDFAAKVNADLNDNLGNFCCRTLKFLHARFGGAVPGPDAGGAGAAAVAGLGEKCAALLEQYVAAMEGARLRDGLRLAMSLSRAGNAFFQETEIWRVVKEAPGEAGAYVSACAGVVALAAAVLRPFMPSFSDAALAQLGLREAPGLGEGLLAAAADVGRLLPAGHRLAAAEPVPLFQKITEAEVEVFRARYAGQQPDRALPPPAGGKAAPAASGKAASGGGGKGAKAANGGAAAPAADGAPAADKAPRKAKAGKDAPKPAAPAAPAESAT
jgi:methionyl-tRNA synthetase